MTLIRPVVVTLLLAAFGWPAAADVGALLKCRQLPMGAERAECLERESAQLERELARGVPGTQSATGAPVSMGSSGVGSGTAVVAPTTATVATTSVPADALAVRRISYQDGKPVFELQNGQVWASKEARTLTRRAGGDVVNLRKSPFGMQLHFNGSFYALPVARQR